MTFDAEILKILYATHDFDYSSTITARELARWLWFYNQVNSGEPRNVAKALWSIVGDDGIVTEEELHNVGIWTKKEVSEIFAKADRDADGNVYYC